MEVKQMTITRPRYIALADKRSPMLRLLQDCECGSTGQIEVAYEQQFRTLFKAERLGLVDKNHHLTEKGRNYIATKAVNDPHGQH
jgi:hypothetical protein